LPIYEYRCSAGHQYERAEGFDAPSEQDCPTCGTRSRRLISLPAVIFKGSGFYSTDNRKGYASGNGGSASGSTSSEDGKSNGGSESKTETKAEAKKAETKAEAKTD
jgi:putative FmdB family regulatory protein